MVRQLIDGRIDEPSELNFGNRPKPLRRQSDRQAGDRGFGERGIDHALRPEPVEEAVGSSKHTAVDADVLAQNEHAWILRHGTGEREIDRLNQGQLRHPKSQLAAAAITASRCATRSAGSFA